MFVSLGKTVFHCYMHFYEIAYIFVIKICVCFAKVPLHRKCGPGRTSIVSATVWPSCKPEVHTFERARLVFRLRNRVFDVQSVATRRANGCIRRGRIVLTVALSAMLRAKRRTAADGIGFQTPSHTYEKKQWEHWRTQRVRGGSTPLFNLQNFLVVCFQNIQSKLRSYTH